MHPRTSSGPLSPIGHPLSPKPPSLLSSPSVSSSSLKSRRRSSTSSRRVGNAGSNVTSYGKSLLQCSACLESLDPRAFARPQRTKEQGATCRTCVWKTLLRSNSSNINNSTTRDGSPGLTSSSSSLSSYSECPTHCSVPLPTSSPPLSRTNSDHGQDEQENNPTVELPVDVSLQSQMES